MNYEGTINIANFRFVHRENAEKSGSYSLSNVIKAGDFRLNVSARTASVCGKELDLIEPEFDVLLFLTRHPINVVTTKTALITDWGGRRVRNAEFLRIVSSIRTKIAAASDDNTYLGTESLVLCRFNPTGVKKLKH